MAMPFSGDLRRCAWRPPLPRQSIQPGQDACSPTHPAASARAGLGKSATTQHQWIRASNRHEARADGQLPWRSGCRLWPKRRGRPLRSSLAEADTRVPAARRAGRSRPCGPLRRGPPEVEPVPMAQPSPSTLPLRATVGLLPSTALSIRGRWRRLRIVCGTGGRWFGSMALRGPHRCVVDVAASRAAALMTGRWW